MLPASVDDAFSTTLADKIVERLIGANFDAIEADLRLRLALEQRLTGAGGTPFGLDRLSTSEVALYLGLRAETLRATAKRRLLGLPEPYNYGKKLFWRRSELDAWVEQQRSRPCRGRRRLRHPAPQPGVTPRAIDDPPNSQSHRAHPADPANSERRAGSKSTAGFGVRWLVGRAAGAARDRRRLDRSLP
jgi:hypothetical protein